MRTPEVFADDHLTMPSLDSMRAAAPFRASTPPPWPATPVPERVAHSRSEQLLDLACKMLGASYGGLVQFSPTGELLKHLTAGLPEAVVAEFRRSPAVHRDLVAFAQRQGPVLCDRLLEHPPDWASLAGLPVPAAILATPLQCLSRHRGLLYLVRTADQAPFAAGDKEKLQPLGAYLNQSGLFEESHLLAQLRVLQKVIQAAAGNLDLARILATALRELDRHLPLHCGAVWLLAQEETCQEAETGSAGTRPCKLVLQACSAGAVPNLEQVGLRMGTTCLLEETPFALCVREDRADYLDLRQQPEAADSLTRQFAATGAATGFSVPLRVGDQTLGVLMSLCHRPTGLTAEQIQLLYLVADLLGPAILNCQMLNRLSAANRELQQAQGQLVQTEKMRALGELAGGMAHDFNNSLCGVLGFIELSLMDSELPSACRTQLESARACALDAAQSVSRVQDFARTQRPDQVWEAVDVNELARLTLELTRPRWESVATLRKAPITARHEPGANGLIRGHAAELRNALTNLVINAVDAMPQGGTLTLRTWSTESDAYVAVEDTGTGIDAKLHKRLFEPFYSTKGERGTGLGLSAVFGIVKRHEGEITVQSCMGRGSTFTIRLPLFRPPSHALEQAPAAQLPTAAGKSARILVVEDEEAIRRFLANALRQLGHQATVVGNAASALEVFAEGEFDVVFTDLGLPGISGEELARSIAERSPRTPVVLLTGWADQIEADNRVLPGVTCVLGKPVALSTLAATLNQVLAN